MNRCKRTAKLNRIGRAMNQDATRKAQASAGLNFLSRATLAAAIRNAARTLAMLGESSGSTIREFARQWGVSELYRTRTTVSLQRRIYRASVGARY